MKCDNCSNPASVHLTEIRSGKQIEKHLCEQCAAKAGVLPVKTANTPINELLTNFVLAHSGLPRDSGTTCEHCGMTWAEFRKNGLLGCEHDYDVFEKELSPLLQRAHDGATHHTGKSPGRKPAGTGSRKSVDLVRLRKELARAVEAEDYERAAQLRDRIRQAEISGESP